VRRLLQKGLIYFLYYSNNYYDLVVIMKGGGHPADKKPKPKLDQGALIGGGNKRHKGF
jgi:hypothetical protein